MVNAAKEQAQYVTMAFESYIIWQKAEHRKISFPYHLLMFNGK